MPSLCIDGHRVVGARVEKMEEGRWCAVYVQIDADNGYGQLDGSEGMRETMVVVCGDAEIGYHAEPSLAWQFPRFLSDS